jgi:hypothetical protein
MSTTYIERPLVRPGTTFKDHTPKDAKSLCLECRIPKARKAFYIGKNGRASPYCIECNRVAALKAKYRAELKREGTEAFADKIARKQEQLDLMVKAITESSVT